MSYETLLVETDGPVRTVTIDRPEVLNALSAEVLTELEAVMDATAEAEAVRVVVLKGAGERAFVAGADLKQMAELSRAQAETRNWDGMRLYDKLRQMP
jgi:enoyl-CoA hydratase